MIFGKKPTVDGIVADFVKKAKSLRSLGDLKAAQGSAKEDQINNLRAQQSEDFAESRRAYKVASKIEGLLDG